jgi:hypothetical protein
MDSPGSWGAEALIVQGLDAVYAGLRARGVGLDFQALLIATAFPNRPFLFYKKIDGDALSEIGLNLHLLVVQKLK